MKRTFSSACMDFISVSLNILGAKSKQNVSHPHEKSSICFSAAQLGLGKCIPSLLSPFMLLYIDPALLLYHLCVNMLSAECTHAIDSLFAGTWTSDVDATTTWISKLFEIRACLGLNFTNKAAVDKACCWC